MELLEQIFTIVLFSALFIHVLLMMAVATRLWRGENVIDRLMALDLLTNLVLAILILGTMIYHQDIFLDAALGLAALGFISTMAFARYITDKRMF